MTSSFLFVLLHSVVGSEKNSFLWFAQASCISKIAHWDWPEQWPELFATVMLHLKSGNPSGVHGAIKSLSGGTFKRLCCRPHILTFRLWFFVS